MSQALNIPDTHKVIERLKNEAGFSEAAARVLVETIQEAKLIDEPVNKADLAQLEIRLMRMMITQFVATVGTLAALYAMFA